MFSDRQKSIPQEASDIVAPAASPRRDQLAPTTFAGVWCNVRDDTLAEAPFLEKRGSCGEGPTRGSANV